jgi:UDP-N-acetylglucosamine:LPS N-acetylglucosamine transferase
MVVSLAPLSSPCQPETLKLLDHWDEQFRLSAEKIQKMAQQPRMDRKVLADWTCAHIKVFRKVDHLLSEKLGYPLHRYCGCQIQENPFLERPELKKKDPLIEGRTIVYPVQFEIDPLLKERSANILSWSLGGGHNVVQEAYGERLAKRGMHVYNIDADREVLDRFDFIKKITFGRFTTSDFISYLIRNKWWRLLAIINWLFSGRRPKSQPDIVDAYETAFIRRGGGDIVITCFDRNVGVISHASHSLNMPVLSVAADFCPLLADIVEPEDLPEKTPFIRSVMVEDLKDPVLKCLDGALHPDQIRFGGLPVRAPFLKHYSSREISRIREKWNFGPDERVIVCLTGGSGAKIETIDQIVDAYQKSTRRLSPLRLIGLCCRNEEEKERLETTFALFPASRIQVTAVGWMEAQALAEILAVAGEKGPRQGALVSGKGGGGTLSEGAAMNVPMLLKDANELPWEKGNISFVCENGLGATFSEDRDMPEALFNLLDKVQKPRVDYQTIDSEAISVDLVKELISKKKSISPVFP